MIACELTKVKESMAKLLLSDCFDHFLLIQAEIVTSNTFTIDGYVKKEFFKDQKEPQHEYMEWKDMREYCYSIIKGQRTPLHFAFVLGLTDENIEKILKQQGLSYSLSDIKGLYMNFRFDGEKLLCTSGVSMNLFTLDKTVEQAWDRLVMRFLQQKELLV